MTNWVKLKFAARNLKKMATKKRKTKKPPSHRGCKQAVFLSKLQLPFPVFSPILPKSALARSGHDGLFRRTEGAQSGRLRPNIIIISKQARQRKDCARQCKNTRCQRRNILRTRQYPGEACERQHSPCTQGKVFLYGVSSPPFCFSQLFHYFPSDSFAILSISKSTGL